jgi:HD superfamily phosphohydrolase
MAITFFSIQIVANKTSKIDVDKMDYLPRDCHGLGMKSDFDYLRYIQNCRVMMIVDDAGKQRSSICIRDKVKNELKNYFRKIII